MRLLLAAALAANLAHLDWLRRDVPAPAGGGKVATWQIYATPVEKGDTKGPYRFVGDEDEGVGCVDDVARAAIVYARQFAAKGDAHAARQARDALAFVSAMRAGHGTYYNFVWADGSINRDGPTSRPGLNWWTARALWALAEGARAFRRTDPGYADALRAEAMGTVAALAADLDARDGTAWRYGAVRGPGWFMGEAPDVTAVAVLGLAALHADRADAATARLIRRYGAAIAAWAPAPAGSDLAGAHLPGLSPTHWHAYGAHMLHALAAGGAAVKDPALVAAARAEADRFTPHLLVSGGPIAGFFPAPVFHPQIAYGVEPQVLGLLALADATGEPRYATMAGLFGSWLTAMYDPGTGRVSDGLDAKGPNADAGAESAIEGLLAVQALAARPGLAPWVGARETARRGVRFWEAEAAPGAMRVKMPDASGDAAARLQPGQTLLLRGELPADRWFVTPTVRRARHVPGERASLRLEAVVTAPIARTTGPRPTAPPPIASDRAIAWPPAGAPWVANEALHGAAVPLRGPVTLRLTYVASARQPADLDGVALQPEVEYRVFETARGPVAVVANRAGAVRTVSVPGLARAVSLPPHAARLVGAAAPPETIRR